jgi:hypothetical protein
MKKLLAGCLLAVGLGTLNSAPPAGADEAFLMCPGGHAGIATGVTSCPFAQNVRASYFEQGGPYVQAYSPVTGGMYDMFCQPGYRTTFTTGETATSVRCSGGNNAVVVVW